MGLRPSASTFSDPTAYCQVPFPQDLGVLIPILSSLTGWGIWALSSSAPSTTPESQLTLNLLRGQSAALDSVRSMCRPSTEPNSRTSNSGILCSVSASDSGSTGGPGKRIAGRVRLPNAFISCSAFRSCKNPAGLVPQAWVPKAAVPLHYGIRYHQRRF